MADYGRTYSGRVNRGGPQSGTAHKGIGLNRWSGGRNAAGSMPGAAPPASTAATDTMQAQAAPAAYSAPTPVQTGPPGYMHQLPDNGPPASTVPAAPSPTSGGSTTPQTGAQGATAGTSNAMPLNIQALVDQLLSQANAKVLEAQSFAQSEQQRVQQMLQTALGSGGGQSQFSSVPGVQSGIQGMLGNLQQYISGINFR